jgi:hypothetical protein
MIANNENQMKYKERSYHFWASTVSWECQQWLLISSSPETQQEILSDIPTSTHMTEEETKIESLNNLPELHIIGM